MNYTTFDHAFQQLNIEQRTAVQHMNGPALVIAGAGSGKTRVATMRIAHLIKQGVDPHKIVAVTFTNKAAREMRERVHALVGSSVLVSTFHSLGAKILRESIHFLGYPQNFVIYAEEESEKMLKNILEQRSIKGEKTSKYKTVLSQIKSAPELVVNHDQQIQSIYEEYQKRLKQAGAVDFDDLIQLPLQLFHEFPEVVAAYTARWHYLLVDEYQDTSESQSTFAAFLAGQTHNIFAVGDPDQSIYSWRGANIANILAFEESFPGAKIIRLEQNYRSTNTILEASNAIIKNNESRYEKSLWSQRGQGEDITLHLAKSDREEAKTISRTIQNACIEYDQIAILYRTHALSRTLEEQMVSSHIPYRIWGGIPFYSRKEIRDVLSMIQIASLPQDILAFERSIKNIGSGIGAVTLNKLQQYAEKKEIPILQAARDAILEQNILSKKQQEKISAFCQKMSLLKHYIEQGKAYDLIAAAINDTGYNETLDKDAETAEERRENLEQLLARAREWDDQNTENASPLLLIEELVLEGNRDQKNQQGPCVTLATIHNAKGLEFNTIFLVGLEEDIFPHINAKMNADDIEEERRLFYVGMTRAKEHLHLSASNQRFIFGALRYMRPSRFIQEIPSEYISKASSPKRQPHPQIVYKKSSFSSGDTVLHPHFGIGKVCAVLQTSVGDAYEVLFSNDNKKRKILADHSPMKMIKSS